MPNAIYVITPYYYASTWLFDDPAVGLKAERFVSGIGDDRRPLTFGKILLVFQLWIQVTVFGAHSAVLVITSTSDHAIPNEKFSCLRPYIGRIIYTPTCKGLLSMFNSSV